jgi:HEAT repeat protein
MLRFLPALTAALLTLTVASHALAQQPGAEPKFLKKTAAQWATQLKSDKPAERRSAAFSLGKLGQFSAGALPQLQELYSKEQDAPAREAIVTAIGSIVSATGATDPPVEKLLVNALSHDPDKLVRRSAACSLGGLPAKTKLGRDALGQALTDPEQAVRQNAAWALGQLDSEAAPMLVSALRDDKSDALVKRDAANALFTVAKGNPKLMRAALNDLLAMCRDPNPEVKKAGLAPLASILEKTDKQALRLLQEVLNDADTEVRRAAALALGNVGGKDAEKAVPVLVDALRNGEPHLKRSAALAIGNVGPGAARAVPDLVKALQDSDPALQRSAATALGGIGSGAGEAVPLLTQMLADANQPLDVRVQAAQALTWIGNIPAVKAQVPQVLRLLGDGRESGDVRVRLAWLFNSFIDDKQVMDSARPTMAKVCAESGTKDNGSVRYHCAYLLTERYGPKTPDAALNVIAEWLDDSKGRIYLGQSIKSGVGSSEKQNEDSVQDRVERDSRTMAVDALTRVNPQRLLQRRDIMDKLARLAKDTSTERPLREEIRTLLNTLNQ